MERGIDALIMMTNSAYHINEFGDKVYGYKKKKPTYQKPRVNNFATNVTEGGHKQNSYRQNNYKKTITKAQGNKETRKQGTTKTLIEKIIVEKIKETKVKGYIPCGVCSETTHGNLLGCPEFQEYIPGQPGGSTSTPKEVCLKYLGTVFRNCMHNSLRYYKKILLQHRTKAIHNMKVQET